jgi:hypothetical protein
MYGIVCVFAIMGSISSSARHFLSNSARDPCVDRRGTPHAVVFRQEVRCGMNAKRVIKALKAINIKPETVSLYSRLDEDTGEIVPEERVWGTCSLTGEHTLVIPCVGLNDADECVEFDVTAELHDTLGSMLGYF